MISALLFDMDGVLFDSRDAARARFKEVLERHGYEFPEGRGGIVNQGGTDPEIIRALIPGIEEEEVASMAMMASEIESPLKYLKENPGVGEALPMLSRKLKLAIVSNDNKANVMKKLGMFGFKRYFSAIITANDVANPKPSPEPLFKALEALGVKKKEEALYIGDNEVDRKAGEAAGIRIIIKGDLWRDAEFFAERIWKEIENSEGA